MLREREGTELCWVWMGMSCQNSELRRGEWMGKVFESEDSAPVPEVTPTYHFFFFNLLHYHHVYYFFKLRGIMNKLVDKYIIENHDRIEFNIILSI